MTRLYTYVVALDFGFAPNPFYGICTLACCKPRIRSSAKVGDWIVGIASVGYSRVKKLVYVMQVSQIITFDDYWNTPEFQRKKPVHAGIKQRFGDNVYHQDNGAWIQANCRHSNEDGTPNNFHINTDTGTTDNVLIGTNFIYWGSDGPRLPDKFLSLTELFTNARNHRVTDDSYIIDDFIDWYNLFPQKGLLGEPYGWKSLAY